MNKEDLYSAIGKVDHKLLVRSEEAVSRRHAPVYIRLMVAAAGFFLLISVAAVFNGIRIARNELAADGGAADAGNFEMNAELSGDSLAENMVPDGEMAAAEKGEASGNLPGAEESLPEPQESPAETAEIAAGTDAGSTESVKRAEDFLGGAFKEFVLIFGTGYAKNKLEEKDADPSIVGDVLESLNEEHALARQRLLISKWTAVAGGASAGIMVILIALLLIFQRRKKA